MDVQRDDRDTYQAWLLGVVLLFGLLGASLALFATYPVLRVTRELPELRLVLDTTITVASAIVAILAGARFSVDGRRLDLLLSGGFFVAAAATLSFGIAPRPRRRLDPAAGGVVGGLRPAARLAPDRGGAARARSCPAEAPHAREPARAARPAPGRDLGALAAGGDPAARPRTGPEP